MQNLTLVWLPPPHVASQLDQTVNLVQTPFAELERNYQDMSLLYLSYYVASGIEKMPLKYGFYKPREVKKPIKKQVRRHEFLYINFHLLRFINSIF